MGFGEAIGTCFRKYFTFSGRARRSEYWWFFLFIWLVSTIILALEIGLDVSGMPGWILGPISSIFLLVTFFPLLAAGWRRLHDTGRHGWYLLLPYVISLLMLATFAVGIFQAAPAFMQFFATMEASEGGTDGETAANGTTDVQPTANGTDGQAAADGTGAQTATNGTDGQAAAEDAAAEALMEGISDVGAPFAILELVLWLAQLVLTVLIFVWLLLPSQPGPNRYGEEP